MASTGVIGQKLPLEPIADGMAGLYAGLTATPEGSDAAEAAIMTTDTVPKSAAVTFEIQGHTCALGGIAKGSGMIHPNMATMLDRKSTRLNSSHPTTSRMPSSA